MKKRNVGNLRRGTSLIETVVYLMIFVVISILVVNSVLIIATSLAKIRLERKIVRNADSVMQRMVREIRLAEDINASSTFGVSLGGLSLRTFRRATDTTEVDADFYVAPETGRLMMKKATTTFMLTESDVIVTNLIFRQITSSSTSKSVKIEMGLQVSNRNSSIMRNFYSAALLRGTYQ